MSKDSLAPSTNVRWLIAAMLMAFGFMNYFNRVSVSVAGDEIRGAYGFTETQLGSVFSALTLVYTICMIPGGWLSDRFGGWKSLALVGLGTGAFSALTGLLIDLVPTSRPMLMLALLWLVRGAFGGFTSPLFPSCGRLVARWIPFQHRALVNALVTGAAMVGMALTYVAFSALLDSAGLSTSFYVIGGITMLIAVVWWVIGADEPRQHSSVNLSELEFIESSREPPTTVRAAGIESAGAVSTTHRPSFGALRRLLRNRSLWLMTLSYSTVGYIEYMIFYWSEHYFKEVLKFEEWQGNLAAMIPPICMGLCMPLGGWLSDRLVPVIGYRAARARVAMYGMLGCSAMLVAATLTTHGITIVICFSAALALIGITEAPAWATAIELGGRLSATSAAIANTGGNLGGTLSPTISPWISALLISHYKISEQQSWAWAIRFACLVCVLGALMWTRIDASERTE